MLTFKEFCNSDEYKKRANSKKRIPISKNIKNKILSESANNEEFIVSSADLMSVMLTNMPTYIKIKPIKDGIDISFED